jgi:hypothetical protein
MSNNHKIGKWLALTALSAATLLLAALPVAAQEPAEPAAASVEETSASASEPQGFTFTIDPIVFGILETTVDTDSAKWEEYRDMSSGFSIPLLNIEGRSADDRFLTFRGENVRYKDARYNFGYGVLDRWGLTVDYNKIPHRFGNNGRMLWTQTSPGVYQIADPVHQTCSSVSQYQTLNETGKAISRNIGSRNPNSTASPTTSSVALTTVNMPLSSSARNTPVLSGLLPVGCG